VLRSPCQDCSLKRARPADCHPEQAFFARRGIWASRAKRRVLCDAILARLARFHIELARTGSQQPFSAFSTARTTALCVLRFCGKLMVGNAAMVFVLDNYDSFTYNLVQYLGELGAEVVVRRNDQLTVAEVEAMHPERILLSPGPCTPQEAGISIDLVRHFAGKLPVLGVCLGHQAIGAAFGGKIVRAPRLMHGKTSQVQHDGKTIFKDLPTPMTATRYHSLIVEEKSLPKDLEISAYTPENGSSRVIMGLRHKRFPVEGVQFHPESVLTGEGKKLIANFLQL
jgi:anthranilate synthase/aminodeoxychorismate synthase-like glutamine amidotransferase